MNSNYFLISLATISLALVFTWLTRKAALRFGLLDQPNHERKIHQVETPLAGGVAIFLAFFLVLFFVRGDVLAGNLEVSHWLGVFAGGLFLIIGGLLDDKYNLRPRVQIIWPLLAVFCVVAGGVEIEKIGNPLAGGFLFLNSLKLPLFTLFDITYYFVLISDLLIMFWLMGMMYTTKLLDGLDGLVTGVSGIGALIIFLFTISDKYYQPDIAMAALILASACLGFLILNWHPAKIFLGEGGSLFLGFLLGVLAIISGGKFAIALLVMGIPILDVAWTIIRRLAQGHNPFRISDRQHLHFRLLDTGLGQRKTVLFYYLFSSIFGLSALFLQSSGKLSMLALLILLMSLLVWSFSYLDKKKI